MRPMVHDLRGEEGTEMLRARRGEAGESGQIVVLFALAWWSCSRSRRSPSTSGVLRNNRQILVNTVDAAALAGGTLMPVDGSVAGAAAAVTTPDHRDDQGELPEPDQRRLHDHLQVPDRRRHRHPAAARTSPGTSRSCATPVRPSAGPGRPPRRPRRRRSAAPATRATRPAIPTSATSATPSWSRARRPRPIAFGGAVGVTSGSTGAVQSAACNGPCGKSPLTPVDVVLIMDRTGSMSGTDTTNAKTAANSIVSLYNPAVQWLGLGLLGPSKNSGSMHG